jgi:hypothetical protein
MKELFGNWTGVTGIIVAVSFIAFALPISPPWLSWPSLLVSIIALGRLLVVGDRHHERVSTHLDMDNEETADERPDRIVDLLGRDRRP